jgi:hypothetical protein
LNAVPPSEQRLVLLSVMSVMKDVVAHPADILARAMRDVRVDAKGTSGATRAIIGVAILGRKVRGGAAVAMNLRSTTNSIPAFKSCGMIIIGNSQLRCQKEWRHSTTMSHFQPEGAQPRRRRKGTKLRRSVAVGGVGAAAAVRERVQRKERHGKCPERPFVHVMTTTMTTSTMSLKRLICSATSFPPDLPHASRLPKTKNVLVAAVVDDGPKRQPAHHASTMTASTMRTRWRKMARHRSAAWQIGINCAKLTRKFPPGMKRWK